MSPSIPFWSFLEDNKTNEFLKNKNVITLLGVRNMWVNAHNKVRNKFKELNVNHIGNIVLADKNTNLVSVLTVAKYMFTGVKKYYKILPPYGVTQKQLIDAQKYGDIIKKAVEKDDYSKLQEQIYENNGVFIKFAIATIEMGGGKAFKKWAKFVLKKGSVKNPARKKRLKGFEIYLYVVLFSISPFIMFFFFLVSLLFYPLTKKFLKKIALMGKKRGS